MNTPSANGDGGTVLAQVLALIEPFNKRQVTLDATTIFATDLDLDSLAVMDLLAAIEDEFDITVPLNMLPDLDTVGKVSEAVQDILKVE
ncbi:MAG: acyl carrier protein [Sphingomonadales bacterium]